MAANLTTSNAGATYVPIATQTVSGSSTTTITFSSIPSTYTDLRIVLTGTCGTGTDQNIWLNYNGDTTTNYSYTFLLGNGTSASSGRGSSDVVIISGRIDSTAQTTTLIDIFNYANTTTYKTNLVRGNNTNGIVIAVVGLWRKTPEAITSLTLKIANATYFTAGTTASLYGIRSA